jgi:hypothetical protein
MSQNKTFAVVGCYILIAVAVWAALGYTIFHFLRKFW